jgi:hypothetical protein
MYSPQDLPHQRMPKQKRPSIGRRIFRTVSRFCIAVLLGVGATLAWQSYGDEAKEMAKTLAPSMVRLLDVIPTKASARATSPELVRQQELIARDLTIVRRSLEHLAARQEQMVLYMQSSSSVPSWAIPILPRSPQPPAKPSALPSSSVSPAPLSRGQALALR